MAACKCLLCGKEFSTPDAWIRKGGGKYCSRACQAAVSRKSHVNTNTYFSWKSMKSRCDDENHPSFHRYGGRGITYCQRWSDFQNFLIDMGVRPPGTTIGRIDNDGNYESENCRWETYKEQQNNRSCNHIIEYQGERMTLSMASEASGIDRHSLEKRIQAGDTGDHLFRPKKGWLTRTAMQYNIRSDTLSWRLKNGWSLEKAVQTPTKQLNSRGANNGC